MNKIILAQLNPISGNIEYNKNKAIEAIKEAIKSNCEMIVFPELFLLGNPIGDILKRYPYIVNQCWHALEEIAEISNNITVLIGFLEENKNKDEKPYFNSIALIKNKKIIKTIKKSILSNNQESNEYKYFEPYKIDKDNRIFNIDGINFGVIINEDKDLSANLYNNLINEITQNVDIILCPASNCSRIKKEQIQNNVMAKIAKKHNIKYVYVNQVGANDELVFDGTSRMYDNKGELTAVAKSFEEELYILNLNDKNILNSSLLDLEINSKQQKDFSLDYSQDLERIYLSIITAIKDYFSKNNFKKAVLGLSGGLDSTICAVLLADAIGGENVYGISMPSKLTSPESKSDAEQLAINLGINFFEAPIKDYVDLFSYKFNNIFSNIEKKWDNRYKNSYTQDNIQARSRAMILWGIANEFQSCLPIATSDKSEIYMGYATINGDMSGGYAPICDVTKTKLFALAHWMNKNRIKYGKTNNAILENIILKPPGAELAIDKNTGKTLLAENALMPYEFLDEVIWRIENLNQTIYDMQDVEFLYESKNKINKEQKLFWLNKFFKRLNTAIYKWYISPPGPIIDIHSINKLEFRQPIVSNINYLK